MDEPIYSGQISWDFLCIWFENPLGKRSIRGLAITPESRHREVGSHL